MCCMHVTHVMDVVDGTLPSCSGYDSGHFFASTDVRAAVVLTLVSVLRQSISHYGILLLLLLVILLQVLLLVRLPLPLPLPLP